MALTSGLAVPDVIGRLRKRADHAAGRREVLSERVRTRIAPKKGGPGAWLDVHREAHRQGLKSTATMMYGHVRSRGRARPLGRDPRPADEHGGFTAFVPWSFKPGNTLLEKWITHDKGPSAYLRMLGASRLYLTTSHVQASWFSEGKRTGRWRSTGEPTTSGERSSRSMSTRPRTT